MFRQSQLFSIFCCNKGFCLIWSEKTFCFLHVLAVWAVFVQLCVLMFNVCSVWFFESMREYLSSLAAEHNKQSAQL